MAFLPDINVLIARTDPGHAFHRLAREWFAAHANAQIATCPLTENGFLRIFGHPSYPEGPGSPVGALEYLRIIRSMENHRFIGDSVSIDDPGVFHSLDQATPKQLTDIYLLGLAAHHHLVFVTFDHKIPASLVIGGRPALEILATRNP